MKKWLKIWLIIWWSLFVAWWAWAGLTKTWVIPNFFNLEALEGHYCWPNKKYSREDNECYQKCKDWCTYEGCHIMGWSCSEACDMMCEVPKYENCISKCKKPKIEWYNRENYNLWYEQQAVKEKNWFWTSDMISYFWNYDMMSYYWNYDII